jgi:pilus assembly protein FimV
MKMSRNLTLCCLILLFSFGIPQGVALANTTIKGPANTDHGLLGHRYGPIRSEDTLWRIAAKVRQDDKVSIYQVMYALYKKNPNSFLDQNYNHLKNDSYLKIPTIREIRRTNLDDARKKAELDDELWAAKQRGELTPGKIEKAKEAIKNVRKSDLQQAKSELKTDISTLQTEQSKQFELLKQSLLLNTEEMVKEQEKNVTQQKRLDELTGTLEVMKENAAKDQSELMAALMALREEEKARELNRIEENKAGGLAALWQQLTESPLAMGLIAGLIIIFSFVIYVVRYLRNKNKANNPPEEESLFDASVAAPTHKPPPIDDDLLPEDITEDSFSLDDVDESLTTLDDDLLSPEEDVVHLDDTLPDDNLYDEDEPGLIEEDSLDGMLAQSDLDDLLGDEDFDLLGGDDDDVLGEAALNDGSSMLDSEDMEDLLNMGDDADNDGVEDTDDLDVDGILDSAFDVDMVATQDDIDALLDGADDMTASQDDIDALLDGADDMTTSQDDIDALLDGADDMTASQDDIDALLDSADDMSASQDDIDALLAGVDDASSTVTDDTDIDDILAQVQSTGAPIAPNDIAGDELDEIELDIPEEQEPDGEVDDSQSVVGADDVDALMDELAMPSTVTDDDDIDAILQQAAAADSPAEEGSADDDDMDIDALLDATQGESNQMDADDIDSLLDSMSDDDNEDDTPSAIDEDVDIDALLDEASMDEPEEDLEAILEGAIQAPVDEDDTPSSIDEDVDIDALLDEASIETEIASDDDIDALLDGAVDEVEIDDIDSLLEEEPEQTTSEAVELDDIDSLLEEEPEQTASEAVELDDIDSLLEEEPEQTASEAVELDDIDSLLEEESEQTAPEEVELDDIDSLLEEEPEQTASEEVELDDIDSLLEEEPEQTASEAVELDDIDSLLEEEPEESSPEITEPQELKHQELDIDLLLEEELEAEPEPEDSVNETGSRELSSQEDDLMDLASNDSDPDQVTEDDEAVESPSQKLEQYPELSIDEADFDIDDIDSDEDGPSEDNALDIVLDDIVLDDEATTVDDKVADFDLDDIDILGEEDKSIADFDLDDIDIEDDEFDLAGTSVQDAMEMDLDGVDLEGDIDVDIAEGGDYVDVESLLEDASEEAPDSELDLSEEDISEIKEAQALNDLESTDFDDILSEIESGATSDDDSLEADDIEPPLDIDIAGESRNEPVLDSAPEPVEDFVEIESLLEGDEDPEELEPYDRAKMDVGLDDFDSLMGSDEMVDVDAEEDGYSAQLDLAKGYLEIGDEENALLTLEEVLADGPDGVKEEANALVAKIKNG